MRVPAHDFYAIDCAIIHRNYRPVGTSKGIIPTRASKDTISLQLANNPPDAAIGPDYIDIVDKLIAHAKTAQLRRLQLLSNPPHPRQYFPCELEP